jgi:hypothetical protein
MVTHPHAWTRTNRTRSESVDGKAAHPGSHSPEAETPREKHPTTRQDNTRTTAVLNRRVDRTCAQCAVVRPGPEIPDIARESRRDSR